MKWADILKRRPLKVNKPRKELSRAEISDIKQRIIEFVHRAKIIELYMEYAKPYIESGEKPEVSLKNALTISYDYFDRAYAEIGPIRNRAYYQGNKVSLKDLVSRAYTFVFNSALNAADTFEDSELQVMEKLYEDMFKFLKTHKEYLEEQDKQYLAEQGVGTLFG
jgi:hypothetical protein